MADGAGDGAWPRFARWIDAGLIGLSLSLIGCTGPASPHGTPGVSRDAGTPPVLVACCGDGHPPAATSCCQTIKGAS